MPLSENGEYPVELVSRKPNPLSEMPPLENGQRGPPAAGLPDGQCLESDGRWRVKPSVANGADGAGRAGRAAG
jgi:hypothetical protein